MTTIAPPEVKRVLIVDDHEGTRRLIRAVLESERRAPYVVEEATTGAECLRMVDTQGPFDLVLLDVNLPDMDGFAICRALRNVHDDFPIVFLSAQSDLASFQASVAAGGDSYLAKPIDRSALISAARLFTRMSRRIAPAVARAAPGEP
jgi:two-component system OmpR family response regulator